MNTNKKVNPLYVVSKNGKDVEAAKNFLDLILKKTGLDQVMKILQTIIDILLSEVKTYPVFIEVKKTIDNMIASLLAILAL